MTQDSGVESEVTGAPAVESIQPRRAEATRSTATNESHGRALAGADIASKKPKQRLSKTIVNFVVDAVLLSLVVFLLFSAAVLRFVFPSPSTSAGWKLWGYGYDAWSNFQFVLVSVIGLAILLHVMLHWSWVCGVVVSKVFRRSGARQALDDGQQTLWGVGLLIFVVNLLGLLVGLAYLMIESPAG